MSFRRVGDLPKSDPYWPYRGGKPPCNDPGHNPPSHIYLENGIYENVCPSCGKVTRFFVSNPTCFSHEVVG